MTNVNVNTYVSKNEDGSKLSMNDVLGLIDFPVQQQPIFREGENAPKAIHSHRALVRTDVDKVLSVMSNKYRTLGNKDVFTAPLSILNSECEYEADRVFLKDYGTKTAVDLLSKDTFEISGSNGVETYKKKLTLLNSFDGSAALRIMFGAWRQICSNGMGIMLKSVEAIRIVHMGQQDMSEIRRDIKKTLMTYDKVFDNHLESLKSLGQEGVANLSDAESVLEKIGVGKNIRKNVVERVAANADEMNNLTLLTLYHAVTEYMRDQEFNKQVIQLDNAVRTVHLLQRLQRVQRMGVAGAMALERNMAEYL